MAEPDTPQRRARFVHHCATRAATPAGAAALRSGLGREPDECPTVHHIVGPFTTEHTHPEQLRPLYAIAALIGHNPDGAIPADSPGDFGASLARAPFSSDTTERYAHLLSRQSSETVCRYLTQVAIPLRTADVPVDFALLLRDLRAWPFQQQNIAARWLRSFYRYATTFDHTDDAAQETA